MKGLVTVDIERQYRKATGTPLHVYVRNARVSADVTKRCLRADSEVGYALVLCKDPKRHDPSVQEGPTHLHPVYRIVCQHRLDGEVTIEPKESRP